MKTWFILRRYEFGGCIRNIAVDAKNTEELLNRGFLKGDVVKIITEESDYIYRHYNEVYTAN
jgi:hypothetical protein